MTVVGDQVPPAAVMSRARELQGEMVAFLERLASLETPTDDAEAQRPAQQLIQRALEELGYRVRLLRGRQTGGQLFARPRRRDHRHRPFQLLIGHVDTVWPHGTLAGMPVHRQNGRLYGPGTFDMKGGLTQIVFALRVLRDLDLEPEVTPVVFINSDEEVGSPESRAWIERLAHRASRALVLEPAMGSMGMIKTARKGVGRFTVRVRGRAAHAGLDPDGGASAILELAGLIQRLHGLNDRHRGISVNVGVVDGGIRPNVIAPESRAEVDVRVMTHEDGERMTRAILGLEPTNPDVRFEISGGMQVPPLERTPRNQWLWEQARQLGDELGLALSETTAGGGSDGNTTSIHTSTLDGLGPVGDGAHASHEHVEIEGMTERCALLAQLVRCPPGP